MEEDSKIIDLLYKREEQALIELSEKYGTACKRIAGNILKNHRDAEECVNDTYLAVWNTIPPKNPNPLRFQISNNNVSVRLSRIRGKLKRYLKKEGVEV